MRKLEFIAEDEWGYFIEKEPITIAAIEATGSVDGVYSTESDNPLLECVVLNEKYVKNLKKNKRYKIMQVRGRRLGRTLDILLDEPITVKETGEQYRIMTFKGCGAIPNSFLRYNLSTIFSANRNWMIDTFRWRTDKARLERYFGAVKQDSAAYEVRTDFSEIEELGFKFTPYLRANTIPPELFKRLAKRGMKLAQPIRLCKTNIMPWDLIERENIKRHKRPVEEFYQYTGGKGNMHEGLIEFLNTLADASRHLSAGKRNVIWTVQSHLLSNMYVDGTLKDSENVIIDSAEESDVLDTAYDEIMEQVQLTIARTPRKRKVFSCYAALENYATGGKARPSLLKSHCVDIPGKAIFVDPTEGKDNSCYDVPAFAVLGYPKRKLKGFSMDYRDSYRGGLTIQEALELEAELKEKGLRLMTRAHAIHLIKQFPFDWAKLLALEHHGNPSMRCTRTKLHTMCVMDHATDTLYDNLVLSDDFTIDYNRSNKKEVFNPKAAYADIWNEDYWLTKGSERNPLLNPLNSYIGSKIARKCPIVLKGGTLGSYRFEAKDPNPRAYPIVVYEFISEEEAKWREKKKKKAIIIRPSLATCQTTSSGTYAHGFYV